MSPSGCKIFKILKSDRNTVCAGSVPLEETLIFFSHMDFQLKTIDLKLQTHSGSKECLSNMSRKELIVEMMGPWVNYRAVNHRFVLKSHFWTILWINYVGCVFHDFSTLLLLKKFHHFSVSTWSHPTEPHLAETISIWGKTPGKRCLLWWVGQSPHPQHSSHHHTASICFFKLCSSCLSWRRCSWLSVLWHIDFSTALSLCLVQWLHATQTFLLYWFTLCWTIWCFVWLLNPYNIDIFQAGGQIKPLETREVHIKSPIAQ